MGQNQYADWFINGMLGWIRWIAGNIAGMFQTSSAHASNGSNMLGWFADNWIKLLLFMIVFGLLIDWIIWMVRWRPYWLWFHKKRILLDDDIDLVLSDEELMRRYAPNEYDQAEAQRHPHFKGSGLGRQSQDNVDSLYNDTGYDGDYEPPDIEDPYLGEDALEAHALHEDIPEIEIDEDDDYTPEPRQPRDRRHRQVVTQESDEDYEKERNEFDALYFDGYNDGPYGEDDEDDEDEDDSDDEEPDISFLSADEKHKPHSPGDKNKKSGWSLLGLLGRRKADEDEEEDDPFSVDSDMFDESDDDDNFKSMVAGINSSKTNLFFDVDDDEDDNQKTPVYRAPVTKISKRPPRDLEVSSELTSVLDDDDDRHINYTKVKASVAPRPEPTDLNPDSRRARRQRRERTYD